MPIRLVSYNIRKAVGLDQRWNPHRILDILNELEPDIVVLQEADRRLGPRPAALPRQLIEAETDLRIADLAINDVSIGWHGNAILFRKGLKVLDTDRIELPSLEPRGAVLTRIGTGKGQSVTVIGAHLALLRQWRRRQLAAIRNHLSREETENTVVAGDFNEWSVQRGFEPLSDEFTVVSPGRTFHSSLPRGQLDRIAHGARIEPVAAGVAQSKLARRGSDHLPIWFDMTVHPDKG